MPDHYPSNYSPQDPKTALTLPPHGPVTCLDPDPNVNEPTARDCAAAVVQMQQRVPWYDQQRTFSRNPKKGEQLVPLHFNDSTCEIYMSTTDENVSDTFALSEVRGTVVDIMKECLVPARKPGFGFGGFAGVGNNKGFYFKLKGTKKTGAESEDVGGAGLAFVHGSGRPGHIPINITSSTVGDRFVMNAASSKALPEGFSCPASAPPTTA
ncbi:MAG: hypothetical protein Q9217_003918 [Psora testacea]